MGKHFSSHTDCNTKDAEPTSTVVGSPEVLEIKDYTSPITSSGIASPTLFPASLATPPLPPDSPEYIPPPPCDDISMCSPCDDVSVCSPCDDISACLPLTDRPMTSILPSESDVPTTPPLPEEIPTLPPLPSEDIPSAPPLPDGEIPPTPPLPDDDIPRTPPLPYEDFPVTPPLPSEDVPSTPPLPMSRSSTTPPLPNEDVSLTLPYSGSLLPPPPPPPQLLFSSEFNNDSDRLTPPPLGVQKPVVSSASLPTVISSESLNVWKGIIHMPDVAKFHASAFEVSGKAKFLPDDVPNSIEVVGRIAPETVWGYIAQMKKSGSKEILVVRFQPANEEEKVSYIALYSYLSSKKRYAVIGNCEKSVKDFYVVPLASHQPIPQHLKPSTHSQLIH
ncbi:formin-2-like [Homarus americanus]|uniref:formin-2-like n=1 Tax=Homarus americanus TaxID=6706 RepID=UPI001C47FF17|nr:formin-2-like [Homarus americanus]